MIAHRAIIDAKDCIKITGPNNSLNFSLSLRKLIPIKLTILFLTAILYSKKLIKGLHLCVNMMINIVFYEPRLMFIYLWIQNHFLVCNRGSSCR